MTVETKTLIFVFACVIHIVYTKEPEKLFYENKILNNKFNRVPS